MLRPRLSCALLLGLTLSACQSGPDWQKVDVGPVPFEDAWDAVAQIAEIDQMPIDAAGTDRGKRVMQTMWRTRSMPFRGSIRRRLRAEFEQPEQGRDWLVKFCVEKQTTGLVSGGFDPKEEDWTDAGQDDQMEMLMLAKLNLRFRGDIGGVSAPPDPAIPGEVPH